MRDRFPGYYRPTKVEFKALWESCTFVLDTNVLLNIYRYGQETRDHFLTVLGALKDRLWIPYQVGLEFHRNRLDVVSQQRVAYSAIVEAMKSKVTELETEISQYKRHPYLDVVEVLKPIKTAMVKTCDAVEKQAKAHPDLIQDDELREKIAAILEGRVGSAYSPHDQKKQEEVADRRIDGSVPPGYGDKRKPSEPRRRGDAILWLQMLDYARATKKPIIFITDDAKDDWWLIHRGQTIGPRPELVDEMVREAEVAFYMYPTDRFLQEAEKFLKLAQQPDALKEVREVQRDTGLELHADLGPRARVSDDLARYIAQVPDSERAAIKSLADLIDRQREERFRRRRTVEYRGVPWTVREKEFQFVGDDRPRTLLSFSSKVGRAHRANYPANWFELSPGDLEELLRTTRKIMHVGRRRPEGESDKS